jgi:hypothetical protein
MLIWARKITEKKYQRCLMVMVTRLLKRQLLFLLLILLAAADAEDTELKDVLALILELLDDLVLTDDPGATTKSTP